MNRCRILILSLARHDDVHASTTFQLAKRFAKDHEVLVVEHPPTWTDILKHPGGGGWKGLFRSRFAMCGDTTVLIPRAVLPINFLPPGFFYHWMSKLNQFILGRSINQALRHRGWKDYYYINSYNYYFPRLDRYLEGTIIRSIYHCVDPIVKAYTKRHGIRNQQRAATAADAVISTAPVLRRKWKDVGLSSHLVPNAVDFEHFDRKVHMVQEIRGLGPQIMGYFGNIERRIDYQPLLETFTKNPNWQLVMAGPADRTYVPPALIDLPNVHFIGRYDYEELPNMIHSVDVALIPFQCDEAGAGIYPLKLHEYFSLGKPVVTTPFNPDVIDPLSDLMYVTSDAYSMTDAITDALAEDDLVAVSARRQMSSENTWGPRASTFLQILFNEDEKYQKAATSISPVESGTQATVLATTF